MLLSEPDAKTKQCRVMPPVHLPPAVSGTFHTTTHPVVCVASGCMHWRWGEPQFDEDNRPIKDLRGYCGLAGRP